MAVPYFIEPTCDDCGAKLRQDRRWKDEFYCSSGCEGCYLDLSDERVETIMGKVSARAAERGARIVPVHRIVDTSQIGVRAGVKRKTVHAWRERHPSFPKPIRMLAVGPLWDWQDVSEWLQERTPRG